VVWVLTKDGKQLRCEVAHGDAEQRRYRITITRPGSPAVIEDIATPAAVIERTVAVMNDLRADGWHLS
jgi:hypothetical protein